MNKVKAAMVAEGDVTKLLRELFYCRVGIGDKVSDLVYESNLELWKRVIRFLVNP